MIPDYLKGKSAAQIVDEMADEYVRSIMESSKEGYIKFLEVHLLLAVKDALCNADDLGIGDDSRGAYAEQRAIAFLNMVLPYEEKKNV